MARKEQEEGCVDDSVKMSENDKMKTKKKSIIACKYCKQEGHLQGHASLR